ARLFVVGRRLPARILKRLARCAHGEDDEIVDLALFLRLHPLVGIKAAVRAVATRNLTGDLRGQIGNVEGLDAPCPAVAVDEALPGRLDAASKRCHHAEPCDDDASHLRFLRPQPISYSPSAATAPSNLRSQKTVKVRRKWRRQLFAFFSRNLMASPTVRMVSAASSGISQPNSSSNAMTSSTVSRLSAPRSSMKLAFSVTFSASTPK